MKLRNVRGFDNIDDYVKYKLDVYSKREKTFGTLFELMFDEQDNVMVETTDGYRIHKVTYGEFKNKILKAVGSVKSAFADVPVGEIIGLYMSNCPEWLVCFWAILAAGYKPLLMNTRLSNDVLNGILKQYAVKGVISDGTAFEVKTVLKEDAIAPSDEIADIVEFGSEIYFMSSGTSGKVKLCAYTGENFYYQICDSVNIVSTCPDIKKHYKGELKHLVLLPLCHVFGFIAVYLWFGFFSRTFVFPRDLNPTTIQRTVKKHEVTHIFAVPMVWDAVAKAATNKIKARGAKTYKRFISTSKLVNSTGRLGDFLARRLLSEVRDGLFGDSITFLISGGSEISTSTLSFFNGIGYHLANGYGMTEIGIVSVERSRSKKILNSGAIGAPFGYTKHRVDENGILLIGGKTRATRILVDGETVCSYEDEWFSTGDMMRFENGRYFASGRVDDMIICENGENIAPQLVEKELTVEHVDRACIFTDCDGRVAVIVSVPGCYTEERIGKIHQALVEALASARLDRAVGKIYFTNDSLLASGEIKISRKRLAQRIANGTLCTFDPNSVQSHSEELALGLERELCECFAEVLGKEPCEVGRNSRFFQDLGGTSIDYHILLGRIREKFGIEIFDGGNEHISTISEFAAYIQNKQ
ncbi:MAG: AMP-binding protein [Clostridia bacterium]|nr:AMP-binding protein [Clostridia bacterium]